MKISVCIPTHDVINGNFFLARCLNSIFEQNFDDFEVVISDDGNGKETERIINEFVMKSMGEKKVKVSYYQTGDDEKKGASANTNRAMKKATGELIKILHMDDYLANKDALKEIVDNFKGGWLVTGCLHDNSDWLYNPHYPSWNDNMRKGNNTIGAPSVITVKNDKEMLFFDEDLKWLFDCEYYDRMYKKFGMPTILNSLNVVIGIHPNQMTNILTDEEKKQENDKAS